MGEIKRSTDDLGSVLCLHRNPISTNACPHDSALFGLKVSWILHLNQVTDSKITCCPWQCSARRLVVSLGQQLKSSYELRLLHLQAFQLSNDASDLVLFVAHKRLVLRARLFLQNVGLLCLF